MKIEIEWQQPILLSKNKRLIDANSVLIHVPKGPLKEIWCEFLAVLRRRDDEPSGKNHIPSQQR